MKRANGTGFTYKLSGNRRRPFVAGITRGFDPERDQKAGARGAGCVQPGTHREAAHHAPGAVRGMERVEI